MAWFQAWLGFHVALISQSFSLGRQRKDSSRKGDGAALGYFTPHAFWEIIYPEHKGGQMGLATLWRQCFWLGVQVQNWIKWSLWEPWDSKTTAGPTGKPMLPHLQGDLFRSKLWKGLIGHLPFLEGHPWLWLKDVKMWSVSMIYDSLCTSFEKGFWVIDPYRHRLWNTIWLGSDTIVKKLVWRVRV